jgi:iron uptake system EfeUOB component EfeO/EfeM
MRRLLILLAVTIFVAGCGDSTTGSGSASGSASGSGSASAPAEGDTSAPAFAESEADTVVHVDAVDYRFELDRPDADGSKVFFEVTNKGEHDHEFEILDAGGKAVDEIEAFAPKVERTLAVELQPGTYTLQCILETNGTSHADLGMTTEFRVN